MMVFFSNKSAENFNLAKNFLKREGPTLSGNESLVLALVNWLLSKENLWIIIQTKIQNAESYSDADLEKLHIIPRTQWFCLIFIKVW